VVFKFFAVDEFEDVVVAVVPVFVSGFTDGVEDNDDAESAGVVVVGVIVDGLLAGFGGGATGTASAKSAKKASARVAIF